MELADTASSKKDVGAYATRPYERHITDSGRKMVSLDLDGSLVDLIDKIRGKQRRGLMIDDLIRKGLTVAEPSMG